MMINYPIFDEKKISYILSTPKILEIDPKLRYKNGKITTIFNNQLINSYPNLCHTGKHSQVQACNCLFALFLRHIFTYEYT
jgi:hypothetical protein